MAAPINRKVMAVVTLALALVALGVALFLAWRPAARERPQSIGLFTTLPLLWNEAEDVAGLLGPGEGPHWALPMVQARGTLVPLDRLSGPPGYEPLPRLDLLVMAQPRPLAPDENVALDRWVRGGGRLLLFADPLLTAQTQYSLGDPRRPQDVAMLSPLLLHWGLGLQFDEGQPGTARVGRVLGRPVPLNLSGRWAQAGGGGDVVCTIRDERLLAECAVGKGRAVLLADAALLERGDEADEALRRSALSALFDAAAATR